MAQVSFRSCNTTGLLALVVLVLYFASGLIASEPLEVEKIAATYHSEIQPLVKRYCGDCHGAED